jgi:hypothetical protein
MCIQGSPVEIQNPTHWNLTGRNVTGTPPVLSPSSILPPLFSDCPFISAKKNLPRLKELLLFSFLFRKSEIADVGGVSTGVLS